ncbi:MULTISPECIES: DUF4328 domain-containing protein [unclassified Sphingopyxis]|uniref:DUF4328 domain-containing protein n=1 Tax=unclassified Sphingopyxis TaxID=2614943 RepID=UPI00073730FA|nr:MULTISPECIES: DUF4328 domain-containing protein [unclassified Sphingopyxis]KTE31910.1 hypothetical protein ATE62_18805 [Sphingopyxis sp. HIX]KTE80146.1 hypothetical protein ATE72_18170 [Sphingopyxis sp. HXXIV]
MTDMTLGEGIALLQRRGRLVKGLLVVGFVAILLVLIGQAAELYGYVSLAEDAVVEGLNALYFGVATADLLLELTTSVIFCMWTYRAAANIKAAGVLGLTFTPAWAVGWHFVPFANFFRPYQAMRQIWNSSHGSSDESSSGGNGLLIGWWGLWSFSVAVSIVASMASFDAVSPDEEREVLILSMLYSVTNLLLYPLAIRLVDRVTRAQRDRLTAAATFA